LFQTGKKLKDIFVNTPSIGNDSFPFGDDNDYARWRDGKLKDYPARAESLIVELSDIHHPGDSEIAALKDKIRKTNMALYACRGEPIEDVSEAKNAINALGLRFGLERRDANLCADEDAITPLSVAEGGRKGRYIPYTNRPISWHTDGYYNKPEDQIRGMILHCIRPAAVGGENALMDPDIAYILMREENPNLIRALMHPDAMLIPANEDGDGIIREAQPGPVFSCPGDDGSLHMRYTARTRSIEWRDNEQTAQAVKFLSDLLKSDSRFIFRHRMAAGEGVLCNNVLHNRSAFEDDENQQRLYLRARYFDRIVV
jgi:hypothetical protein